MAASEPGGAENFGGVDDEEVDKEVLASNQSSSPPEPASLPSTRLVVNAL